MDNSSTTSNETTSTNILTADDLRVAYITIGSLGILGNLFVVVVIFSQTHLAKRLTNVYIVNQSLVDATTGLFLILTTVFENDGRVFTSSAADTLYCRLWLTKLWLWGFLNSSTYNMLAVTFERYLAVVHPVWHKVRLTRAKVHASVAVIWVGSPAYCLAYAVPTAGITPRGSCTTYDVWPNRTTQRAVAITAVFIHFLLPLTLLVVFYVRMVVVLRARVAPNSGMSRARLNIIKTLALVACSFVLCWVWNQVYFLLFNLGFEQLDFTSRFYHFTVVMVFCNCCVNPIIYAAKYREFQVAIKRLCHGKVSTGSDATEDESKLDNRTQTIHTSKLHTTTHT